MKKLLIENIVKPDPVSSFYKEYTGEIWFEDGKLSSSTYSYEIDSQGQYTLNYEQTYQLYLAMKECFEK